MDYNYLKAWVDFQKNYENLEVENFFSYKNQYKIKFRKKEQFLQINLNNDSFCFFCSKNILPFKKNDNLFSQLQNAKLKSIKISENDRVISFVFNKLTINSKIETYTLILELVPKFTNIVLLDNENIIVDALHKFSLAQNSFRQILPKMSYEFPPNSFQKTNKLENDFICFKNINLFFEEIYYEKILKDEFEKNKNVMLQKILNEKKNILKKIEKQKKELETHKNGELWNKYAKLLNANYNILKKGMEEIEVIDYYEDNYPTLKINLFKEKSPSENIKYYSKKHKKALNGKLLTFKQIEISEKQLQENEKQYLRMKNLDYKIEFEENRKEKKLEKNKKNPSSKLNKIKIGNSYDIFIGKTAKENDFLTTKFAHKSDLWFHCRMFSGSHIILKNYEKKEIPQNIIILCCRLAAYYSKAKNSANVPVDFTKICYVRKPRGSKEGKVIYTHQKTIFVNPLSIREANILINSISEN